MSAHHLLLIEDDAAEGHLAVRSLKKISADIQVTHLSNGIEFLDYVSDDTNHPVDLALMDLHMPGMGGLEFMQKLRSQGTRLRFPVVVFSSSENPEEVRQAYELGVSAFVTKPVDTVRYRQSLRNIVAFWLRTNRLV